MIWPKIVNSNWRRVSVPCEHQHTIMLGMKYLYILTSCNFPDRHYIGVTGDLKSVSGRAFAKKRL